MEKSSPPLTTISDFRKENEKLITVMFKNTVKAAQDLGVIGLEQLSIDGSKVKASASRKNAIMKNGDIATYISIILPVISCFLNNSNFDSSSFNRISQKPEFDKIGRPSLCG
jgi:hypothetical protein